VTENQGDCNDGNASIHPNADEICGDGIDQNCNGQADEECDLMGGIGDDSLPKDFRIYRFIG
jgi:hypothetical protein